MITDNNLLLAGTYSGNTYSGQAVTTGSTGATLSTNAIDLEDSALPSTVRDIGEGNQIYAFILVTSSYTSSGSAALNFQIWNSASTSSTSGASMLGATGDIGYANLTAGAMIYVRLNPINPISGTPLRYIIANQQVGTAACTGGAAVIGLTTGIQDGMRFYPSGFSVS
jgi:hypothetical protein